MVYFIQNFTKNEYEENLEKSCILLMDLMGYPLKSVLLFLKFASYKLHLKLYEKWLINFNIFFVTASLGFLNISWIYEHTAIIISTVIRIILFTTQKTNKNQFWNKPFFENGNEIWQNALYTIKWPHYNHNLNQKLSWYF